MTQTSKAFPYSSFIPYYTNGLQISNDATTPTTTLDVATGTCVDSTGTWQISLTTASTLVTSVSGLGGLDTGTIAASTLYAVYLIADVVKGNTSGVMLSLASNSSPTMPYGYNAYALIGYCATDGSSHILSGYWTAGESNARLFMYDAPKAALSAGNATSATAIVLTTSVPPLANVPVIANVSFTPNAASHTVSLKPTSATGYPVVVTGQVAAVAITSQQMVFTSLISSTAPEISYIVSNSSDAATVTIAGYWFFI